MFVVIKTNNATEIVIHVPAEGAEKSLPAIAGMLENNAVFIQGGYYDPKLVTPDMNIVLGNSFKYGGRDDNQELIVKESTCVIDEHFQKATPEVMVSNKAAMDKKDKELKRARDELDIAKKELEFTRERLATAEQQIASLLNPAQATAE